MAKHSLLRKNRIVLVTTSFLIVFFLLVSRKVPRVQPEIPEQVAGVDSPQVVCPTPPFQYLSGNGAVISLASFPGSGNTWVRHLLQRGSGVVTGSKYNDKSLMHEFPAEGMSDSRVIAVKTHFPCGMCWQFGPPENRKPIPERQSGDVTTRTATIQVLRSPFGALLSDFNHFKSGANHTGVASAQDFESSDFEEFVVRRIHYWTRHASYYLSTKTKTPSIWLDERKRPVLLIYYEALKRNPVDELVKMFSFIKRHAKKRDAVLEKLQANKAAQCAVAVDSVGAFKRTKPQMDPYSKQMSDGRTLRQFVCESTQQVTKEFWNKDDPEWRCT